MTRIPEIFQWLFPRLVWKLPSTEKVLYLTFDDGPIPELTEFVLAQLKNYNAQATFFCIGDNILKHPEIYEKVNLGGHSIGNHTFKHENAWKTEFEIYLKSVNDCKKIIENKSGKQLFRPPYGRITPKLIKHLNQNFKIIMWTVLTKDYDQNLDKDICLNNAIKYSKSGDIIVFHDSLKAEKNLRYVLPKYLAHFANEGYTFRSL